MVLINQNIKYFNKKMFTYSSEEAHIILYPRVNNTIIKRICSLSTFFMFIKLTIKVETS